LHAVSCFYVQRLVAAISPTRNFAFRNFASDRRTVMDDKKQPVKPGDKDATGKQPDMGPQDEAPPGTPGTGENIDPKTGEKYVEGIGGG
jgi:hypothetical protein